MFKFIQIRLFCTVSNSVNDVKLLSKLPKKITKQKSLGRISQHFVDNKRIKIFGGKGGDGLVSFMHLYANEFAGPDGGDGGNGGHVIFKADHNTKSLNKLQTLNKAENGGDGGRSHMRGKNGEHLIIKVPVGTTITEKLSGEVVAEFKKHEQLFIAAHGGAGGKGNYYYLANDNKEPLEFEPGHPGEEREFFIELKIIADVGLLGYPNVGKSSLLNAFTRANSKVGDYSFTTLYPHVGIAEYEDMVQISIADLPGLLPDPTRGLGTGFLRHVERCKIIAFVVDLSIENPIKQYHDIRAIIDFYDPNILKNKPIIILANKIDLDESKKNLIKVKSQTDLTVIPISPLERINITKFLIYLRSLYDSIISKQE